MCYIEAVHLDRYNSFCYDKIYVHFQIAGKVEIIFTLMMRYSGIWLNKFLVSFIENGRSNVVGNAT